MYGELIGNFDCKLNIPNISHTCILDIVLLNMLNSMIWSNAMKNYIQTKLQSEKVTVIVKIGIMLFDSMCKCLGQTNDAIDMDIILKRL